MYRMLRLSCRFGFAVSLTMWIVLATSVQADDIEPAPYRGQPNSVTAKFDLQGNPMLDLFAEGLNPTYALSTVLPSIAGPTTDPTTGDLSYQATLPNYIDQEPLKRMRVQYSWSGINGDAMTDTIMVVPNTSGSIQIVNSIPPTPIPGSANDFYRWDDFEIFPNPDFETIQVTFKNADPRWLVFDTISIPEPSNGWLGLSIILLFGWRQFSRKPGREKLSS